MLGSLPVTAEFCRRLGIAEIIDEVFGILAGALGDDRIARALDAIAPELDHIVGSVGARAIDVFGIDVSRMH
jgi:hypothetical protein